MPTPLNMLKRFRRRSSLIENATTTHIYKDFVSFRTQITILMLIISDLVSMGFALIQFLISKNYLYAVLSVIYTLFLVLFLSLFRKKPLLLQCMLILDIFSRCFMRTLLLLFFDEFENLFQPYTVMVNLMITVLIIEAFPSLVVHSVIFVSEVFVVIFYEVFFREEISQMSYHYAYLVLMLLHLLNRNILDKKMWSTFARNYQAKTLIESLKLFLNKNLLSSVVIFSIPDEIQQKNSPSSQVSSIKELRVELQNSNYKKLVKELFAKKVKTEDPSELLEKLCSCFVKEGTSTPLSQEILSYAEQLSRNSFSFFKSISDTKDPDTFLCELIQGQAESFLNISQEKSPSNLQYKVVLSPILFDNKPCIILQLEDISYIKSWKMERKMSQTRESTIQ